MRSGLRVDEPIGERWDLALGLIEDGEDAVLLGNNLKLRRDVGHPGADGRIHVSVFALGASDSREQAQSHVDRARAELAQLADDDPRFGSLLQTHGEEWEYVEDYGMGSALIAPISEDGTLVWVER